MQCQYENQWLLDTQWTKNDGAITKNDCQKILNLFRLYKTETSGVLNLFGWFASSNCDDTINEVFKMYSSYNYIVARSPEYLLATFKRLYKEKYPSDKITNDDAFQKVLAVIEKKTGFNLERINEDEVIERYHQFNYEYKLLDSSWIRQYQSLNEGNFLSYSAPDLLIKILYTNNECSKKEILVSISSTNPNVNTYLSATMSKLGSAVKKIHKPLEEPQCFQRTKLFSHDHLLDVENGSQMTLYHFLNKLKEIVPPFILKDLLASLHDKPNQLTADNMDLKLN